MFESLKNWILNICTAVFFITAAEMLLPNNDMKKYSKFVLGIILITVFLNPIIKIFDSNYSIASYSDSFSKTMNSNEYSGSLSEYEKYYSEETLSTFEENLKINCEKELKAKYPKDSFDITVSASYNDGNFQVDKVKACIKEGGISRVKKVQIVNSESKNDYTEIKEYISTELNVPKEDIEVYEL